MATTFSAQFIESQKLLLLALDDKLSGRQTTKAHVSGSGDFADISSEVSELEQTMSLVSNQAQLHRDVRDALRKISNGGYGLCELSGEVIHEERLKALPWARYTIKAQEEIEKRKSTRHGRFAPSSLFDKTDGDADTGVVEAEEESIREKTRGRAPKKKK
jgi:RNA polymerase-binding transcription factor DksA